MVHKYHQGFVSILLAIVTSELTNCCQNCAQKQEKLHQSREGEEEVSSFSDILDRSTTSVSRKNRDFLSQSAYSQSSTPKPQTHLRVLTHKKQRTFVKNQKRGESIRLRHKESDRKRWGKVKVPPLYKVRIMGRKAEGGGGFNIRATPYCMAVRNEDEDKQE
jgi:hypothetical protein